VHIAYIDYQKTFDSVLHSWLIYVLQNYKIHPSIIHFLNITMQSWRTTLISTSNSQTTYIKETNINQGIFQGDALSAPWFILAINPLSTLFNSTKYGFVIKKWKAIHTISHLLYMDDLKIYPANDTQLKHMINNVHKFSEDTGMTFGLDKCRTN
jgi:hypothetical protein